MSSIDSYSVFKKNWKSSLWAESDLSLSSANFVDVYLAIFNQLFPLLWDHHHENGESVLHLQQCYVHHT